MTLLTPPQEILYQFCSVSSIIEVTSLGQGNINDTFLVHTKNVSIVLQRINDQVFPDPEILIDNLQHLTSHLLSQPDSEAKRWQEAVLVPALDGSLSVHDSKGSLWRALSYIEESISFSNAETALQAEQTGWALGHFHKRLHGLDVKKMQLPLPGFHDLRNYLHQYKLVNRKNINKKSLEIQYCLDTIRNEQKNAFALEKAIAKGIIRKTIIHGDPKMANVLFAKKSGFAISLIDLDTVGPGILQHDIGDCLRSVCNIAGEGSDPDTISFDLDLCEITLKGYFCEAGKLLTPIDRELIFDGIKAITFELGLRFFTDYLQGGIYFKCSNPEETLQKALVQFALLHDIIAKEKAIHKLALINTDNKSNS